MVRRNNRFSSEAVNEIFKKKVPFFYKFSFQHASQSHVLCDRNEIIDHEMFYLWQFIKSLKRGKDTSFDYIYLVIHVNDFSACKLASRLNCDIWGANFRTSCVSEVLLLCANDNFSVVIQILSFNTVFYSLSKWHTFHDQWFKFDRKEGARRFQFSLNGYLKAHLLDTTYPMQYWR